MGFISNFRLTGRLPPFSSSIISFFEDINGTPLLPVRYLTQG